MIFDWEQLRFLKRCSCFKDSNSSAKLVVSTMNNYSFVVWQLRRHFMKDCSIKADLLLKQNLRLLPATVAQLIHLTKCWS